ncbi:MAG: hypothetical protein H0U46_11885 [Actinobacteria bacterium]|nr:hypothetical protein [Actinomycetota bacterium]
MKLVILAAIVAALVPVLTASTDRPSTEGRLVSADRTTAKPKPRKSERCLSSRVAVAYYRQKTWVSQLERGAELADRTPIARGKSCHWSRYAASVHQARARTAHERTERWRQSLADPDVAIEYVFGGYADQAKRVAACESGDTDGDLSPSVVYASNGQYQGMFQMGSSERSIYGHGSTPLEQARAAYAYFVASGRDWSPWACKPY